MLFRSDIYSGMINGINTRDETVESAAQVQQPRPYHEQYDKRTEILKRGNNSPTTVGNEGWTTVEKVKRKKTKTFQECNETGKIVFYKLIYSLQSSLSEKIEVLRI